METPLSANSVLSSAGAEPLKTEPANPPITTPILLGRAQCPAFKRGRVTGCCHSTQKPRSWCLDLWLESKQPWTLPEARKLSSTCNFPRDENTSNHAGHSKASGAADLQPLCFLTGHRAFGKNP